MKYYIYILNIIYIINIIYIYIIYIILNPNVGYLRINKMHLPVNPCYSMQNCHNCPKKKTLDSHEIPIFDAKFIYIYSCFAVFYNNYSILFQSTSPKSYTL